MKSLRNKTSKPLKVRLRGGKILHLGPFKTGQVADQAAEEPSLKKLIASGEVEIMGDGVGVGAGDGESDDRSESTQGHPPTKLVRPKGNR